MMWNQRCLLMFCTPHCALLSQPCLCAHGFLACRVKLRASCSWGILFKLMIASTVFRTLSIGCTPTVNSVSCISPGKQSSVFHRLHIPRLSKYQRLSSLIQTCGRCVGRLCISFPSGWMGLSLKSMLKLLQMIAINGMPVHSMHFFLSHNCPQTFPMDAVMRKLPSITSHSKPVPKCAIGCSGGAVQQSCPKH